MQKASDYDQEMTQSKAEDQPMAPRGIDTNQRRPQDNPFSVQHREHRETLILIILFKGTFSHVSAHNPLANN